MKLTIFNCSPKLGKNNTEVMLKKFVEGFTLQNNNKAQVFKLNKFASMEEAAKVFSEAEAVLIAFPLYCYAMPGGLKLFIEALEPFCKQYVDKKLAFLVQYGFREAIHARPVEKYLMKLSKMLGYEYVGTIIKGGCDGLASGKGGGSRGILNGIYNIGVTFGKTGEFDTNEINKYSLPEYEKKRSEFLMKFVFKIINKVYWGKMLQKNGVSIEDSWARPYEA